jgi:3-oxoacyl-[acyl-carrier-protein] synthase II
MGSERRVAITGCGAICSLGFSVSEIWEGIVNRSVGYRRHTFEDDRIVAKFFGLLDTQEVDQRCQKFPRSLARKLSAFARYALLAASEAMDAAGGPAVTDFYPRHRRGVILGTGWGGLDAANTNTHEYYATQFGSPFTTIMSMNNAATAALSMHYGMRGYQNTPVAACASGAIAIGEAAEIIRSGRADFVLAGGAESLRHVFNVWSIDVLEALTKEQSDLRKACCPFSADRSGFVLSEGAAVVCVEDMEQALGRGARILAEITGYSNYSDAHDFTAPAPDGEGRCLVITHALEQARLRPSDVHYINAHGTSTPLNDYYESEAIKATLGDCARRVHISSTKSYTGHLIGAAGALETILCLKVLETGMVPATIHLDRPDPRCDLDYTPNEHRRGRRVDACLKLSFGFGGANAALVLERPRGAAATVR